jgi:hypothetical protein
MDVQLASGLIVRDLSVCGRDGRQWVVPPSRLKVDDNNVPTGIGDGAVWEPLLEFRDQKTRDRFIHTVLAALRRDHPNAFEARSRSPPLVDDPLPF